MKQGYIYIIYNLINNKIYIGKTVHTPKRRWQGHYSSAFNPNRGDYDVYFHRSIRKHGIDNFKVDFLWKGNVELLSDLEQDYITYFKNKGYVLYNLTSGGEGVLGRKWTDRQYEIMSNMFKGEKNHFYGKRGSKNPRSKSIIQYSIDGKFIKEWESIRSAELFFGIGSGDISLVCNGKRCSSKDFVWRFKGDNFNKYKIPGEPLPFIVPVYQLDKNNNVVSKFESVTIASRITGINISCISECLNGKQKTAGGFFWKRQ